MLSFDALVRGRVTYEGEHGEQMRVPLGACTVAAYEGFVSLAWTEGGCGHSAVLSVHEFEEFLEARAVVIVDSLGRPPDTSSPDRHLDPDH